ncbi:MAG: HAD-IIA family hydrolase [candidate division Zixibacteria bacterium]|nr:HAD-IIA family hydrolase [candidate division Zixibacteria bacterium]
MKVDTIVFDLEGVVYRSGIPIPGAISALHRLSALGFTLGFFTNASVHTREQLLLKLRNMGVNARSTNQLATSCHALADYFITQGITGIPVLVIGEAALEEELKVTSNQLRRVSDAESDTQQPIAAVAMGFCSNFSYDHLLCAQQCILDGARFYATDIDPFYPDVTGKFYPAIGWQVAAVMLTTGVRPVIVGKPESYMIRSLLGDLGAQPSSTLVVGDSAWSDIQAGNRAGCRTCLVRSGIPQDLLKRVIAENNYLKPERPDELLPDFAIETICDLESQVLDKL